MKTTNNSCKFVLIRGYSPFWFLLAVCILVAAWFVWRVLWPAATTLTHGYSAYYSASRLLATGELSAAIYDPEYFRPLVIQDSGGRAEDIFNANPPTTTLMFWPLAFLPIEQARLLWTAANVVFLSGGLFILLRSRCFIPEQQRTWKVGFVLLIVALLFRPVIQNFLLGQAYILVFFLLSITAAAFSFFSTKNRTQITQMAAMCGRRWPQIVGGVSLALALLFKTAGWPILILLLWLRRWRFLGWVVGLGAAVFLFTLPLFPLEMWLAYGRLLGEVNSSPFVCVPAYQTTRSWLCHLFAPTQPGWAVVWQTAENSEVSIPWPVSISLLLLAVVTLVLLLRLARTRPVAALMGIITWSILFLPLGEIHHHTVLLIPLAWLIGRWSQLSRPARMALLLAVLCYLVNFPVNAPVLQSGWLALLAYPYLAGAWLIFLGILWDNKSEIGFRPGEYMRVGV